MKTPHSKLHRKSVWRPRNLFGSGLCGSGEQERKKFASGGHHATRSTSCYSSDVHVMMSA
eukprot:scaffold98718_cov63-Phaeocystis_antarctica.AAC.2